MGYFNEPSIGAELRENLRAKKDYLIKTCIPLDFTEEQIFFLD